MKKTVFILILFIVLLIFPSYSLIGARQLCKNGVVILFSPGGTGKPGTLSIENNCMVTIAEGIEEYFENRGYKEIEYLDLYRDYGIIPLDFPVTFAGKIETAVLGVSDMFLNHMANKKFMEQGAEAVKDSIDKDKCVLFLGRSNGASFIIQTIKNELPLLSYPEVNGITFGAPEAYDLDDIAYADPRILYWEHKDDWVAKEPSLVTMLLRFLSGEPWPAHEYSWGGDVCIEDQRKGKNNIELCANFDELPLIVKSFLDKKYYPLLDYRKGTFEA